MLVDKNHRNILSLLREVLERLLDRRGLRLGVYHEEVSLGIGRVGYVLHGGGPSVSMHAPWSLFELRDTYTYPRQEKTCD